MSSQTFIELSPREEIWMISGWVTAQTKFIQTLVQLKEPDIYVLEYLHEFQLVQPENDIINFYTHDVLAPKGSSVLCVSAPQTSSDGVTTYHRKSYLFPQGEASEVYQALRQTLDQFLDLQIDRLHKWECVTVYRPYPHR